MDLRSWFLGKLSERMGRDVVNAVMADGGVPRVHIHIIVVGFFEDGGRCDGSTDGIYIWKADNGLL